jgi:hypothetical protein
MAATLLYIESIIDPDHSLDPSLECLPLYILWSPGHDGHDEEGSPG